MDGGQLPLIPHDQEQQLLARSHVHLVKAAELFCAELEHLVHNHHVVLREQRERLGQRSVEEEGPGACVHFDVGMPGPHATR